MLVDLKELINYLRKSNENCSTFNNNAPVNRIDIKLCIGYYSHCLKYFRSLIMSNTESSNNTNQLSIPFVSEFDEEEDELYYYHRDNGKPIHVIDYYAPHWDDDEKLTYSHVVQTIPAVIELYEQIKDDSNAEICHLVDFTVEEDSDPLPFIIAAVRNPRDVVEVDSDD